MRNKFIVDRPPFLLVGVVVLFLAVLISRGVSEKEASPAFLSNNEKKIYVELTKPDSGGGVYQINDGSTLCGVIKMTNMPLDEDVAACAISLVNGERIKISQKGQRIDILERGWMAAGKRMALSVPLHPDRMSLNDWTALNGIGEVMAEKIENDRQKNGDFGSFENLKRVRGIGEKSLKKWRYFFVDV